ncbi:MAG: transcriptional repressor [Leptospiraceae bacterium]|nr:transcriptional repressor [Leptospiraceae bacterium]MCP5493097.1 transcriptional repressor [Leptospiraceae bacterium]
MNKTERNERVEAELKVFSDFLRKKGLKITSQRMLVAEKIFSTRTHFTADSLLDGLKDRKDEISKATIYRILGIMVEANLIVEHNFGQDFKYYEHIARDEHHDHIICIDCNRIVEFINEEIEGLQKVVTKEKGFTIKEHQLNIFASCVHKPECEHYKKRHS